MLEHVGAQIPGALPLVFAEQGIPVIRLYTEQPRKSYVITNKTSRKARAYMYSLNSFREVVAPERRL